MRFKLIKPEELENFRDSDIYDDLALYYKDLRKINNNIYVGCVLPATLAFYLDTQDNKVKAKGFAPDKNLSPLILNDNEVGFIYKNYCFIIPIETNTLLNI